MQRQERDVGHGNHLKGAEVENGTVRCVLCRDSSGCFVRDKETSGRIEVEKAAERLYASVMPPFPCPLVSALTIFS